MSRQCRSKVELIQLGLAHIATSIYGMRKKIETLNSVNRRKRKLLHVSKYWSCVLGNSSPPHLTPPQTSALVFTEWSFGTRGNQDGALWRPCFKGKHGFCQNAGWSFSSVADYFLYHLNVIKRRYFIWNKKACVLSDKALILPVLGEFWS